MFTSAYEQDPEFAAAYGMAARTYTQRAGFGWISDFPTESEAATGLARMADRARRRRRGRTGRCGFRARRLRRGGRRRLTPDQSDHSSSSTAVHGCRRSDVALRTSATNSGVTASAGSAFSGRASRWKRAFTRIVCGTGFQSPP